MVMFDFFYAKVFKCCCDSFECVSDASKVSVHNLVGVIVPDQCSCDGDEYNYDD